MGLKDKFAESFAKAQTMSESEKRANEIMSKLIFKKATIPLVLMLVIFIASLFTDITWWAVILINSLIALGTYFYLHIFEYNLEVMDLVDEKKRALLSTPLFSL